MIRLTYAEWQIVFQQCSECKYWDNTKGCEYPEGADNAPVDDCGTFARPGSPDSEGEA